MDNDEAEELGKLRRKLEGLALGDLTRIAASTLDELIDVCRQLGPGNIGLETAAAVSAELHKRNQPTPPLAWAAVVGNA